MNGLIQVQTEALRNFNICIKHKKKKKENLYQALKIVDKMCF